MVYSAERFVVCRCRAAGLKKGEESTVAPISRHQSLVALLFKGKQKALCIPLFCLDENGMITVEAQYLWQGMAHLAKFKKR